MLMIVSFGAIAGAVSAAESAGNGLSRPRSILDGVWIVHLGAPTPGNPDPGPPPLALIDGKPIPYQPWSAAIHQAFESQSGGSEMWPGNNQRCLVAGTLRAMRANYPWRLVATADQVTILFEEDGRVNIFPFRKQHRANVKSTWTGDSIARWDGDTLVVDTIGINGKTPLPYAIQITNRMHMVHHFRLISGGDQLEDRILIDDPGAFTSSFEVVSVFDKWSEDYNFAEYRCAENNLDFPGEIVRWKATWGPL
jgi:hypothetical protein